MSLFKSSSITCLHAPHGLIKFDVEAYIAICLTSFLLYPHDIILNSAVLSAQLESPYEIFSTLQPKIKLPSLSSIADPTLNDEYGEYEYDAAS